MHVHQRFDKCGASAEERVKRGQADAGPAAAAESGRRSKRVHAPDTAAPRTRRQVAHRPHRLSSSSLKGALHYKILSYSSMRSASRLRIFTDLMVPFLSLGLADNSDNNQLQ